MLSDHSEAFDDDALNGTTSNSCEPRVSVDNHEFDARRFLGHLTCENDLEQEEGRFDIDTAQWDRGAVRSELSPAAPELRTPSAQSDQARGETIENFEQFSGPSRPERHFHTPSIVVSDSANDEVADGCVRNLSESCSSSPSHTSLEGIQGTAVQDSCTIIAPFPRDTRSRNLDESLPSNYELATQDRQRPDIPNEVEPQSETFAVDSLRAFNVDADSTATDAAAAGDYPNTNLLHVKRPRLSSDYPGFQTMANEFRSSKPRQEQSALFPKFSAVQSSSQTSTYPSPTLSSEDSSTYQHRHSVCFRETTPSIQTALSCNDPNEPLPPASPSPSISLKTDDSIAWCLECPDVSFEGPNRKNSLQRHQRDHHSGRLRLKCLVPKCTVTFAPGRPDNRLRHVGAKHPDFPLPASTTKRKRSPSSE